MSHYVRTQRPAVDETVWQPSIPLVVIERYRTPSHLAVWLALRWLMAAFPRRKGFGRREIAKRAKVSQGRVVGYIDDLIQLDLVVIIGYEEVRNLPPRPIYSIDLLKLARESCESVLGVLVAWGVKTPPPPQPPEQLDLNLGIAPTSLDSYESRARVQKSGLNRVQVDPYGSRGLDSYESTLIKRKEKKEEALTSFDSGSAADENRAPDPPIDERPLTAHPIALWRTACPACPATDVLRLADYAADHDRTTDGYGWYWVGRAVLALIEAGRPMQLTRVRGLLQSWRSRSAYGADAPGYHARHAPLRERAVGSADATPVDSSLGRLWADAQPRLQATLEPGQYTTWLADATLLDLDGDQAIVGAPNVFARDHIDQHYATQLAAALGVARVEIVIGG